MALTKKQREKLRMKFGGRCAYCGCELPEILAVRVQNSSTIVSRSQV